MAELPELETLRRELEKESVGKRFKVPEVVGAKVTKRNGNKKVFQSRLEGAKVKSVDRRGPYLSANLDNGELLLIDLGDKGYLEKVAPRSTAPKGTLVTFAFTQGGQIRLVDTGGTAQAFVAAVDNLGRGGARAGRASASTPSRTPCRGRRSPRVLLGKNVKLKTLLMDGEVVAGIGPIYSDEILWEAGLRHDRVSSELSSQEIRRLFRALVETLHEAVKHRGSTRRRPPLRRPLRQAGRPPGRAPGVRPRGRAVPPLPGPDREDPLLQQAALLLRGLPGLTALRGSARSRGRHDREVPWAAATRRPFGVDLAAHHRAAVGHGEHGRLRLEHTGLQRGDVVGLDLRGGGPVARRHQRVDARRR